MFFSLKRKASKAWFDIRCREILDTPPIPPRPDDPVVLLSGVGNDDVLMYLVAIKSFERYLGRGKVMLLVPDDCPAANLEVLKRHVNPFRIVRDSEVKLGRCLPGGTWERLVSIARETDRHYVIQVDSDTVTLADIPDVRACVESNTSFTISTWKNQTMDTAADATNRVKDHASQHVQMLAEQRLMALPNAEAIRYVRGQSSFSGFARGSASFDALEDLSVRMEQMLGAAKWREWGSESFASNYLIANAPTARLLPFPKYATFTPPKTDFADSSFLHFEGTHRFRDGYYIEQGRRMIGVLQGRR